MKKPGVILMLGGWAVMVIAAGGLTIAALIEAPIEPTATFTAFKVDVNDALEEPFTDTQIECVVILAEVGDARVLMAGPCVTTYP